MTTSEDTNSKAEAAPPKSGDAVVERVRAKLNDRKGSWKELTARADNAFTYRWLAAFAKRDIIDPSYTHLVALAKVLDIKIGVKPKANGKKR